MKRLNSAKKLLKNICWNRFYLSFKLEAMRNFVTNKYSIRKISGFFILKQPLVYIIYLSIQRFSHVSDECFSYLKDISHNL